LEEGIGFGEAVQTTFYLASRLENTALGYKAYKWWRASAMDSMKHHLCVSVNESVLLLAGIQIIPNRVIENTILAHPSLLAQEAIPEKL
jgi:hypothetical protein